VGIETQKLRVAIVHYWLLNRRGGERVVEAFCELFPQADIFTLVADPEALSPALRKHKLTTSFLQKVPGSRKLHRHMLPLYPLALEQFDLRGYDLVISSESGPAKGVLVGPDTYHICYCHTPMRYIWDFYHQYKSRSALGPLRKGIFALTAHYARIWDRLSADRVDYFIANSENIARRIKRYYGRDAEVIYPPVDVSRAECSATTDDHYLAVGQLVSYKRFDLAIEACNRLGRRLRVVGTGEEYKRLKRIAGRTVSFLGSLSDAELRPEYASCRALLFPGEEDFGIVPVEAQAYGRPVIAFGKGGARETVIPAGQDGRANPEQASGIFFREQTLEDVADAILSFESMEHRFSPEYIRSHAEQFDKHHFLTKISRLVAERLGDSYRPAVPYAPEYSISASVGSD
jgi:glycosyltransferase involved in cell wall biosynthesis